MNGAGEGKTIISAPLSVTGENAVLLINNGANVKIGNLTVNGKNAGVTGLYGVKFMNASGSLNRVTVTGITAAQFNGAQEFRAIDARATVGNHTLTVTNSVVADYQKSGIYVSGAGMSAVIENNNITGKGDTAVIAQNGVTIMAGAKGEVKNNTISAHNYTTVANSAFDILFYDASATSTHANNKNTNNENSYFKSVNN